MPVISNQVSKTMHPFVDRQEAIEQFEGLIDFEHPTGKPFLQFYGMGGIGKSFLINHLKSTYLKDIPTVHIVFEPGGSDYSYDSLLRQIMRVLRPKLADTTPFRDFKAKRDQWLHESNLQIGKIENTIMASGGSTIEIGMSNQSVVLEKLRAEIRQRITEEFLDTIEEIEPCPLLIILDAVENLLPEMQSEKDTPDYAGWLLSFLLEFCDCFPTARVLSAGRHELTYDSLKPRCQELKLFHLPEGKVTEYLEQLGIHDKKIIEAIYRLTNGYSLSVSMIGDLWQDSEGSLCAKDLDTQEFHVAYRNKLVPELLMRRIMERADEQLKPVIKGAGLFRYFTYQILKETLFPDLQEQDFQRLIKYTFISKTGKHYQYHAVLRRLITEAYLEQDPDNFRRDCTMIYQYFAGQESDERFYYGFYGQIEGIIDEWVNMCSQYYTTWQTERLKFLIDIIEEIRQPFSKHDQAIILSVKGEYFTRQYHWNQALDCYHKSEHISIAIDDKVGLRHTYSQIGRMYFKKGACKLALDYCCKSEEICLDIGDKTSLGQTYYSIGEVYIKKGEWDKALEYCQKSERIRLEIGDQMGLGWVYHNIGFIYSNKSKWEQALNFYQKSERVRLEIGDQMGLGWTYHDIGLIYSKTGNWEQALEYYRKSVKTRIEAGDRAGLGWTYHNIGSVYRHKEEWQYALSYYEKSERVRLEIGDQKGLGWTYHDIGLIYSKTDDWEQALNYYQRSGQIFADVDDRVSLGCTDRDIAIVYYHLNDNKAIRYIEQSVATFEKIGAKHGLEKALEWQKKIYDKLGNE